MRYFDRNGKEIVAGSSVRLPHGGVEKIVALGMGTLGYLATRPEYKKRHPEAEDEYYALSGTVKKRDDRWDTIVDCEIIDGSQNEKKPSSRPYVVDVTEITRKRIVVYGENDEMAWEKAGDLVEGGKVDMDRFTESNSFAEVIRRASASDLERFETVE